MNIDNKEWKVIKQKDDISCVACVACMITNTPLSKFHKFMEPKKAPYFDLDIYKYLLKYGFVAGIGFELKEKIKLSENDTLNIQFRVTDFPAYVVVKSMRFPDVTHAVFWTGKEILDPNPKISENGLPLKEYEVEKWWPISKEATQ